MVQQEFSSAQLRFLNGIGQLFQQHLNTVQDPGAVLISKSY